MSREDRMYRINFGQGQALDRTTRAEADRELQRVRATCAGAYLQRWEWVADGETFAREWQRVSAPEVPC